VRSMLRGYKRKNNNGGEASVQPKGARASFERKPRVVVLCFSRSEVAVVAFQLLRLEGTRKR
jgi:hypothetical protein